MSTTTARIPPPPAFIGLGVLFAVCFWLLDSLIDSLFFTGETFFKNLLQPAGMELYLRLLVSFMLVLLGFVASKYAEMAERLNRYFESDMQRRLNHKKCYKVLFDHAPIAMIVLNADLRIVSWNRKAEELFGWRLSEVAGMKVFEAVLPVRSEFRGTPIENIFKRHGKMTAHNLSRDGYNTLWEWTLAPVLDGADNLIHVTLAGTAPGEVDRNFA